MPFPLVPVIAAGSSLISQGINAGSQANMNKKQRQWNEKMYAIERTDNRIDRDYQNMYDSPTEQMKRLKAGGLNPNLVYGNGSATQASAGASPASAKSYNPKAVETDIGGVVTSFLAAYQEMKKKDLETDLLKAQIKATEEEASNKKLIGDGLVYRGSQESNKVRAQELELSKQYEYRPYQLQSQIKGNEKLQADINYTKHQDQRAGQLNLATLHSMAIQNSKTVKESEQIAQNIVNAKKDGVLKEIEIKIRESGLNPNDPIILRKLGELMSRPLDKTNRMLNNFYDWMRSVRESNLKK